MLLQHFQCKTMNMSSSSVRSPSSSSDLLWRFLKQGSKASHALSPDSYHTSRLGMSDEFRFEEEWLRNQRRKQWQARQARRDIDDIQRILASFGPEVARTCLAELIPS